MTSFAGLAYGPGMSILMYVFGRLSLSPRGQLIDEFNREIHRAERNAADIYIAGCNLIRPYHDDFSVREIYKQGVRHLKDKGDTAAMELCVAPLAMDMKAGYYFKQSLLSMLINMCEHRAGDPASGQNDLEDVIDYLEQAASNYSEHPELANEALTMTFDLINSLGQYNPAKAASIVARHFPHEAYMFADNIIQQLRCAPSPA